MSRTKNTANQPPSNQNLRKIYDDLVADHTIFPGILFSSTTPTRALRDPTHSSRRLVLGLAIFENFPEQMSPLFPDNIAVRPAYQKQNIKWGEWSSLVCPETWGETSQLSAWKGWVNRMQSRCDKKWWDLGIREAIMTSKNGVLVNPVLLPAAILFCSPALNSFVFPKGFMTPTVEDVFALLGLPPNGIMCHPNMDKWETKKYELPNVTLTDFISS
ncbi:hypothetical protein SO802_019751 [Lithocarpus litseifolius]|uniref:Uncharacterized protein n=1 Tax=Lithocarpus litseifolius TaxID=425828 RepID=A0AAW2CQ20_9ROSI